MDLKLKIFLLLIIFFQLFLIVKTVRKKRLSMRCGGFWIFLLLIMTLVVIFPNFLFILSDFFGFEVASNMIFLVGFFFLFSIIFILTTSISIQNHKIKILIQDFIIKKLIILNLLLSYMQVIILIFLIEQIEFMFMYIN